MTILNEGEGIVILPAPKPFQDLVSLAKNCLERLSELITGTNTTSINAEDNEMEYLQFTSAPTSRRQSSNKFPPSLSPSSGTHIRSSSLSVVLPLTTSNESHKKNPVINLGQLRREHESVLVAQQRELSQRILRARAGTLERNEAYVSDLLKERQSRSTSFNERLGELLASFSSKVRPSQLLINWEGQWRRKSLRTTITEIAQNGQDAVAVIEPLCEMFAHPRDPLAQLLREFLNRCRQQIKRAWNLYIDTTKMGTIVNSILDEVGIVENHIVDLFTSSEEEIPELKDPAVRASIRISLQQFLCSTSLGPSLLHLLIYLHQNESFSQQTILLNASWEQLFARLKVRPKLQLPRDRPLDMFPISDLGIYARPVTELRAILLFNTPYEKLMCLVRCCNSICQVVNDFKRSNQSGESGDISSTSMSSEEGSTIGSEDLLLLCAYVILRAAIPDLSSQLNYISKLVPEELIRGEAGYSLATVQTSLDYALSCLATNE